MNLPAITSAKIVIIKQFTLTNFVEKYQDLDRQFNFLVDLDDYIKYYQSMEFLASNSEDCREPIKICDWGSLMPMRRKHTLRSYWRSFRFPSNMKNETKNELFLLLPLKVNIPVRQVMANGKKFEPKSYIYLFPFGSGCINVEIDLPNLECSIDNFSDLISNLMNAHFSLKANVSGKGFKIFSLDIAKILNEALFANEDGIIMNDKNHSYIYLETSIPLSLNDIEHKKAIAAIMTTKHVANVKPWEVDEKIKCKLEKRNPGEILIFSPNRTLIYPSSIWIEKTIPQKENIQEKVDEEEREQRKVERKCKCMCKNYCSFINVIFAVNGFLKSSYLENKERLPKKRAVEIARCFTTAFLKTPEGYYNKKLFNNIASEIGLNEHLNKLTGEVNESN